MIVWVCLLLFWLWPWRTPWSPRSRKHLLDRLELLICPFRNKPRNTVKITVITCSSSGSLMGKQRPGERIPAGSWSVRKTRHETFAVAWTHGRVPSPAVLGWQPMALLSPACAYKRASLSVMSFSVPYLASHGAGPKGAAVLWAESKWRVTASACQHVRSFGTFKLHLHCLICFLKAQKWDCPVNRMWGGKDADLGWLLPLGGVQQSTKGRVTVMKYILNTHCAVLTTNSLHSG